MKSIFRYNLQNTKIQHGFGPSLVLKDVNKDSRGLRMVRASLVKGKANPVANTPENLEDKENDTAHSDSHKYFDDDHYIGGEFSDSSENKPPFANNRKTEEKNGRKK